MSRRSFSQPSLADAFVKAYSKGGGFLEDLMKTIEWSAFEVAPGNGTTGLVGRSLLQMTWNGAEHDESKTED